MVRTVSFRANGMQRLVAVRESDEQIHAKVDALYEAVKAGERGASLRLDIWLGIERTLCPMAVTR